MGADVVIAVELSRPSAETRPPRNLLHIMLYSLALVQRPQIALALQDADVAVRPDLNGFGVIELERLSDMIRVGREAAAEAIPAIRAAIARVAAGEG
jgi:predicted acylesterase/phospholipase RssA